MTNNLNARDNVDYTLVLLPFFAEMCTKPAESEKITKLRKEAIWQLYRQLAEYKQRGYIESLLSSIAKKKAGMIMNVTSKTEMEKLMNPRPPYFDGNRFIPDEYHIQLAIVGIKSCLLRYSRNKQKKFLEVNKK